MAYGRPVRGAEYVLYVMVMDVRLSASPSKPLGFLAAPVLQVGDFKVSTDGGPLVNLNTLPVVQPVGSKWIKVTLSATEMDGANVNLQAVDQYYHYPEDPKWADLALAIQTTI